MIKTFIILCFLALFLGTNSVSYAQSKELKEKKESTKSVEVSVREYVDQIKEQNLPSEKKKKLSELIELVNKEFTANSKVVTDLLTKILEENKKEEGVSQELLDQKNAAEAIYNQWVIYKVALQPNYDLFIEKKDSYHCDVISEEIWKNYTPIAPQTEKVELDLYTKKAVATSVELAEDLCKFASEL